jgi:hypothetical protein
MRQKLPKRIFIVKFCSHGIAPDDMPYLRYSKSYRTFGIIDTGGNIDEAIERFRRQENEAMRATNKGIIVETKVVSIKKINVSHVLVSQSKNKEV